MFSILNRLQEKEFVALRIPFKSGRQSPKSMGGMLLFGVLLQLCLFTLVYLVAADRTGFPFKTEIFIVHLILTVITIFLSIIFSIPKVYRKHEAMQYMVVLLVTLNIFGIPMYLSALFLAWPDRILPQHEPAIMRSVWISLVAGLLVFIVTWIRFLRLLKNGEYREGSERDAIRGKWEAKSLLVPAVIVGTSLSLILQSVFKSMGSFDGNIMMIIVVGLLVFYTILFVLPEQMMLVYCKRRFKSFNFDKDGNVLPLGSGERK